MINMISSTERFKGMELSSTLSTICSVFDLKNKKVLDIGCSLGQYLAHFGKGSVGITTAEEEVSFGLENNLPVVFGNAENLDHTMHGKHFEEFWANNLFEHLLAPHGFLMKLKKNATDGAVLILVVPVVSKVMSLILRLTVQFARWKVVEVRPFIFRTLWLDILVRPFAPHMYVVAKNDPAFTYPPKKIYEWKDDGRYAELLTITHQST